MKAIFITLFMLFAINAYSAKLLEINNSEQNSATPINKDIERGGTVELFDENRKLLFVDGKKYSLPFQPLKVNYPAKSNIKKINPGTKIIFKTSKHNYSNQEQVTEIHVIEAK